MATVNQDKGSLFSNLDELIALFGGGIAVSTGVDPKVTVAIQCIAGHSIGKHFVMNGPTGLTARYSGMLEAFGKDKELFRPHRDGNEIVFTSLATSDYDALLDSVKAKKTLWSNGNGRCSNEFLGICRTIPLWRRFFKEDGPSRGLSDLLAFPLWRWSLKEYGHKTWLFGYLALGLLPTVTVSKWIVTGSSPLEALVFFVLFFLSQLYVGVLLDVRRKVCYVRVRRDHVSEQKKDLWDEILEDAKAYEGSQDFLKSSAGVMELQRGHARTTRDGTNTISDGTPTTQNSTRSAQNDTHTTQRCTHSTDDCDLAVPIIELRPRIEFREAKYLFLASPIRYMLFPVCSLVPGIPHEWAILYAIAAITQSYLQNEYAAAFLEYVGTRNIFWFRRLPNMNYDKLMEGKHFSWDLP